MLTTMTRQSWREIDLQDPSLWDTIVTVVIHPWATAIQAFLHRSRNHGLTTCRLAYSGNKWLKHFIRIMKVLPVRGNSMWVSLTGIIRSLESLSSQKSQYLTKDYFQELPTTEKLVFEGGAPRLSRISLTGVSPGHFRLPLWENPK